MSDLTRIGKAQYAEQIGVTERTLARMLNIEFYTPMRLVGYRKHQKHLTQAQIKHFEKITVNLFAED